jgi:hypothetical protein
MIGSSARAPTARKASVLFDDAANQKLYRVAIAQLRHGP